MIEINYDPEPPPVGFPAIRCDHRPRHVRLRRPPSKFKVAVIKLMRYVVMPLLGAAVGVAVAFPVYLVASGQNPVTVLRDATRSVRLPAWPNASKSSAPK